MTSIKVLTHANVKAYFDEAHSIAHIEYSGVLTAEATTLVYDWLTDLINAVGIDNLYGEVFNFTKVTQFQPENLSIARQKSRGYNMRNNVKKLPVAMIVANHFQEEILRGPMQNVEDNKRKTIVWNMNDALNFLHEWHEQHE